MHNGCIEMIMIFWFKLFMDVFFYMLVYCFCFLLLVSPPGCLDKMGSHTNGANNTTTNCSSEQLKALVQGSYLSLTIIFAGCALLSMEHKVKNNSVDIDDRQLEN